MTLTDDQADALRRSLLGASIALERLLGDEGPPLPPFQAATARQAHDAVHDAIAVMERTR